jgi:hypothetical protein
MCVNLAVILCAVALALLIYRYDLYEKEPWANLFGPFGANFANSRNFKTYASGYDCAANPASVFGLILNSRTHHGRLIGS